MSGNTQYVMRLYRARCECGTLDNYLNIPRDHGILAGADQQPLLNANDHTDQNVIHFGKCNSDHNPERMFRKGLVSGAMGPLGFLIGDKVTDFLEDVGIMTCNCKPNTLNPWIFVNEDNLIEGAPALLMESKLTCRYGGVIELVPFDEYPPDAPAPITDEKETTEDDVRDSATESICAAMDKIATTGDQGAEAAKKMQALLTVAAAMAPSGGYSHSCVGEIPAVQNILDASYDSAFVITDSERARNYAHNMAQVIPSSALDKDGLIVDQGKLNHFRINNYSASYGGCGAIALFNVIKSMNPQADISFPQIIYWMEPYGILNNTFGAVPMGISDALNAMGYDAQFVPPLSSVSDAAANADAAIVLYVNAESSSIMRAHYVTFVPTGDKNENGQPRFKFYNEIYPDREDIRSYEDFEKSHCYFKNEDGKSSYQLWKTVITIKKDK